MTLVPSENNSGELSYVLIMAQNESEAGEQEEEEEEVDVKPPPMAMPRFASKKRSKAVEEEDLTVYDFEDVDPIGSEAASVSKRTLVNHAEIPGFQIKRKEKNCIQDFVPSICKG